MLDRRVVPDQLCRLHIGLLCTELKLVPPTTRIISMAISLVHRVIPRVIPLVVSLVIIIVAAIVTIIVAIVIIAVVSIEQPRAMT